MSATPRPREGAKRVRLLLLLFVLLPALALAQSPARTFEVAEKADRLLISCAGKPVAEYVFADPQILRPYFTNIHAPSGQQVTRNHPPVDGRDAVDHAQMHPGLWLAFGDVSGHDFWRNQGRIEHLRFTDKPTVDKTQLAFATRSRLVTREGTELCQLESDFLLVDRGDAWLLVWNATFYLKDGDVTFGDQEEMGFGIRMATPLTEKAGGVILNSAGQKTAAATWGKAAKWCDYSGKIGDDSAGITLMAAPDNFRESWWHNRDYGLMVANPFGRAALKQGEKSVVSLKGHGAFRITFGAAIHDGEKYDPAAAYVDFVKALELLR